MFKTVWHLDCFGRLTGLLIHFGWITESKVKSFSTFWMLWVLCPHDALVSHLSPNCTCLPCYNFRSFPCKTPASCSAGSPVNEAAARDDACGGSWEVSQRAFCFIHSGNSKFPAVFSFLECWCLAVLGYDKIAFWDELLGSMNAWTFEVWRSKNTNSEVSDGMSFGWPRCLRGR